MTIYKFINIHPSSPTSVQSYHLHWTIYSCIMDIDTTAGAILAHHNSLRRWPQSLLFDTPCCLINLTVAFGDNACTRRRMFPSINPLCAPPGLITNLANSFILNTSIAEQTTRKNPMFDIWKSLTYLCHFFANHAWDIFFVQYVLSVPFPRSLVKPLSTKTHIPWKLILQVPFFPDRATSNIKKRDQHKLRVVPFLKHI